MGVVVAKKEVSQRVRSPQLHMINNKYEVPNAKYKIIYWAFDGFCQKDNPVTPESNG